MQEMGEISWHNYNEEYILDVLSLGCMDEVGHAVVQMKRSDAVVKEGSWS